MGPVGSEIDPLTLKLNDLLGRKFMIDASHSIKSIARRHEQSGPVFEPPFHPLNIPEQQRGRFQSGVYK